MALDTKQINNWDVTEDVLASEVYQDDIKGIDALEKELFRFKAFVVM